MCGAYLLALDDTPITSEEDVTNFFSQDQQLKNTITLKMGTIQKLAMHPDNGVPIMYFNQLNMIAHHLRQIKYGTAIEPNISTDHPV